MDEPTLAHLRQAYTRTLLALVARGANKKMKKILCIAMVAFMCSAAFAGPRGMWRGSTCHVSFTR